MSSPETNIAKANENKRFAFDADYSLVASSEFKNISWLVILSFLKRKSRCTEQLVCA